jgi:AmmeMemoRadiSam system protein B
MMGADSLEVNVLDSARPAAVAGSFYPATPSALGDAVDRYLAAATSRGPRPKAIVAPHAGYIYSGPIAGNAFARLAMAGSEIERVVLIGPSHRVFVRGLATPGARALATPLGLVLVDEEALALVDVPANAAAHAREHALEVMLPFLQRVAPRAKIAPFCVGDASPDQVAKVIDTLWGGPETVIVVSSDLSHYLPYEVATELDAETAERIASLTAPLDPETACGARGIDGLITAARRRGMKGEILDVRNSGDTAGDRERVVGYGAFAFHEKESVDGAH